MVGGGRVRGGCILKGKGAVLFQESHFVDVQNNCLDRWRKLLIGSFPSFPRSAGLLRERGGSRRMNYVESPEKNDSTF